MKVYLIKHKGATIWQNMFFDRELTFSDGNKINTGILFFRKKDAEAYLKTLKYTEFYEVVGANVPKSIKDNRRKNDSN
jgi:hypothetical protein